MIAIFVITYHFTRTTTDQENSYKTIVISCSNRTALDDFYTTYLSNMTINEQDQNFLNTKTFQDQLFKNTTNDTSYFSLYLIALIHENKCIGFAQYKLRFLDIGQEQGQYMYNPHDQLTRDYNFGLIEFIYIHPDYRNKGFAKTLINNILKNLELAHYDSAQLIVKAENSKAINLYKKLGFSQINVKHKTMFVPYQQAREKFANGDYLLLEKKLS